MGIWGRLALCGAWLGKDGREIQLGELELKMVMQRQPYLM